MARKRTDSSESVTPLRLRVPASLAVAVLGGAATVAMSFGACDPTPTPEPDPVDAGELSKTSDAGTDTSLADGDDPMADAGTPDTPRPVDAAPLLDAYVPPDTPQG
jgi:hypothetical protein